MSITGGVGGWILPRSKGVRKAMQTLKIYRLGDAVLHYLREMAGDWVQAIADERNLRGCKGRTIKLSRTVCRQPGTFPPRNLHQGTKTMREGLYLQFGDRWWGRRR
jgi:hypothetical protein